jgi:hypothetical protein
MYHRLDTQFPSKHTNAILQLTFKRPSGIEQFTFSNLRAQRGFAQQIVDGIAQAQLRKQSYLLCKSEREGTGMARALPRPNQKSKGRVIPACRHKAALCDVPTGAASRRPIRLAGLLLQAAAAGFQ